MTGAFLSSLMNNLLFKSECIFSARELLASCETFIYYISGIHGKKIYLICLTMNHPV